MNIDLNRAKKAFDTYLDQFDRADEKVNLKIVHTDGVIACMDDITSRMGLSEDERKLAELIALLHDIGRFEQLKQFDSFEPATMDHARFGVGLLFGGKMLIRDFVDDTSCYQIVDDAIRYHSDYKLPEDLDETSAFFAKLIRDADKLDNCRVKLEEKIELMIGCSAEEVGAGAISDAVWQRCLKRQSVLSPERQTKIDYWVSYVAYFFDINFGATAQIILENDFVDRIIKRIPYSNRESEQKMLQLRQMVIERLQDMIYNS